MKSVYSAVRTGTLNKAVCASSVKGEIEFNVLHKVDILVQFSAYTINTEAITTFNETGRDIQI
jgi:hypothetical protein